MRGLLTPLSSLMSLGAFAPRQAFYRASQVVRGFRPALAPAEVAEVRARLSDAELVLFVSMEPRDRRHSLNVLRRIQRSAAERRREPSPDLLVAALLHDTGKGSLRVWHRVAFVLLQAVAPPLARRLESPDGRGWRQALWRLRHHARLGAERLTEAGSRPRVIELVAAHASPGPVADDDLAWLIEADGAV